MAIYFLLDQRAFAVKIGRAADVELRSSTLQTGNPVPLVLLGVVEGHSKTEAHFHELLKPWRRRGEWFEYNKHIAGVIVEAITSGLSAAYRMAQEQYTRFTYIDQMRDAVGARQTVLDDAARAERDQHLLSYAFDDAHLVRARELKRRGMSNKELELHLRYECGLPTAYVRKLHARVKLERVMAHEAAGR